MMKYFVHLILISFLFSVIAADVNVVIQDPWIRLGPSNAKMLAGYLTFVNNSNEQVVLEKVCSERFDDIEIHQTIHKDGVARMRHIEQLIIPSKERVALKPGGLHLMLMNPSKPLMEGEEITMHLSFASGYKQQVNFVVKKN